MRPILTILVGFLALALPASAQQRPSVSSLDAAQKRMNAAICAKADADGDTYRPFTCDPRCDCLAPLLLQFTPTTCEETAPGVFGIGFHGAAGECVNGRCTTGVTQPFGAPCHVGGTCPSGTVCETNCFGQACFSSCQVPCTSSASCPLAFGGLAQLSGVSAPDSSNVVQCIADTDGNPFNDTAVNINSNDALECLARVEAATPCD